MSETRKAHCNRCGRETNHDILASDRLEGDEEDVTGLHHEVFSMLKCRGCGNVILRHIGYFSEDILDCFVTEYPPATARRTPAWIAHPPKNIPDDVGDLMHEVYTAAQNNLRRLAAMGIRAALEMVMITKVGDQGTFPKNLDAFQAAGYLSLRQRNTLEAILEAGHASIHRGWEPTRDDLETLLDITESVIESVYLHEGWAKFIEGALPPRRRPS